MTLKDGTTPRDPRLGRIPQHDPANARYPIRHRVDITNPLRSYTWQVGVHLDQGREGGCVGWTYTQELACRPQVVDFLRDPAQGNPFAQQTYWEIQRNDQWDGGAYPGADPFYEGTSVLAGAKTLTAAGWYTAYHWGQSEREIALAVGYKGPVVIGVDWHEGMFDPDPDGFLHVTGEVAGGHCTLLNGISLSRNAYRLHNSWGASWGENGEAWLSRTDMARLLADGGEACLPVRGTRRA